MLSTCEAVLSQIQELWPRFERLVGLRGRKMYEAQVPGAALVDAVVDLVAGTYSTCTPVRSGDDPEQLGLNLGSLPGGRFLRGHLQGEPPPPRSAGRSGQGFDELEATAGEVDRSRPLVEFYTRHNEIELCLPVAE